MKDGDLSQVVRLWEMEAKAAIHAICLLVLVLLD
jgi:hypothetical protein